MSKKIGLLPTCWGNSMWLVLGSVAFVYNPDLDNSQKYYDFFANLGYILPCEECKEHYIHNFDPKSLQKALESSEGLFRWVYDLHNKVNKGLGVPESQWPSYESVKKRYESFKTSCDSVPGACGSGLKNPKRIKLVEEFGSDLQTDMHYIIPLVILSLLLAISLYFNVRRR